MTFTNRTCLITGSDGFLAAHLALALAERGARVVGLSLSRRGHSSLTALGADRALYRQEYGDVTDLPLLCRLVNSYEVDYVFHLAAVSAVRIAAALPYRAITTNTLGTAAVLEACRYVSRRPRGIVVASSDKAYGASEPPYCEHDRLEPTGTYEASKAAAEMIARAYKHEHRLPVAITRCANLYGPGDLQWSRLVPGSVKRALAGEAPIVYQESAASEREFLHVADAVRAYLLLAEAAPDLAEPEVNLPGERACILAVAEMVSRCAGGPRPLIVPRAQTFTEIPTQYMLSSRAERLGWAATVPLAEGLRETVAWYGAYLACRPQVVATATVN